MSSSVSKDKHRPGVALLHRMMNGASHRDEIGRIFFRHVSIEHGIASVAASVEEFKDLGVMADWADPPEPESDLTHPITGAPMCCCLGGREPCDHHKRDAARTDSLDLREPHPGKPHEFRATCLRCGEPGMVNLSILAPGEVVKIEPAALTATETPGGKP